MPSLGPIERLEPEALSAQFLRDPPTEIQLTSSHCVLKLGGLETTYHGEVSIWRKFRLQWDGVERLIPLAQDLVGADVLDLGFFYPFSNRSSLVALPLLASDASPFAASVVIADVEACRVVDRLDGLHLRGLIWNPEGTQLVLLCSDRVIFAEPGCPAREAEWAFRDCTIRPFDGAAYFCAWTPSGATFALRDYDQRHLGIAFYDSLSLRQEAFVALDPLEVFPFDARRFLALTQSGVPFAPTVDLENLWGPETFTEEMAPYWWNAVYEPDGSALALSTLRLAESLGPLPPSWDSLLSRGLQRWPQFAKRSESAILICKAWIRVPLLD